MGNTSSGNTSSGNTSSGSTPRVRLGYGGGGNLTGESARNTQFTLRRLFQYARPYTWQLLVVALLVIVGTISSLAGPILFGIIIDRYVIPADAGGLGRTVLLMLVIYLAGGLAAIIYGLLMVRIAQRLVADVRAELFNHLQSLSMAFHDSRN